MFLMMFIVRAIPGSMTLKCIFYCDNQKMKHVLYEHGLS